MGVGPRSQSLRGSRPTYRKLQEGRLRRALSLRQGHEKSKSWGLEGGTEGLDAQEQLPVSLGDTEQLIQAQHRGSWVWLRQYQQVRRRWESFVTSFPIVTLSRPASPEPPLGTNS
ncbi:uncharacterized protein C11orf86 homolog isoform X2 [Nycticebus coucang]|uniref:uncharacterized protein C11orf86 homolog isoform X2 n=1 Tax=Nycticebus coucang TaxID=9470 RepID=UPI00234C65D5|nr:uncharacterized protein C11orf86 homolog isoform X2 [Nycticebus coucang]